MNNSVFKKREVPYTQVPNVLLNSRDITLKAKGLWAYMNSKPNGWQFSATRISEEIKEDRKAVLSAMKELIDAGYLISDKRPDGRMEYTLAIGRKSVCSKKEQTQKISYA